MNELHVFLLELKLSIISVHKNFNFSRVISAALTFSFFYFSPSPCTLEVAGVMSEIPPLPLRYQAFRQHTCSCSLEAP